VNEPAVPLKVALLALGAIDTVGGTVIAPVEVNAIVVAEATGLLIVTVQTATAAGEREAGVHARPLRSEVVTVVTVPPVALVVIWVPSRPAPKPLETPIDTEVVPAASVTARVATLPLEIRLVLMPLAMHM
jgi:hypothetical protein